MTEALAACILEEQPEQGITMVNGKPYMANAKGALVPLELVKPADKLRDETVRKVMGYAKDISAQISRFRKHSMTDLDSRMKCWSRNTTPARRREGKPDLSDH